MTRVYEKLKKQKVLLTYLLFSIMMFLISVVIIFFYFYPQNIKNIERVAEDSTRTMAVQISDSISPQMETILAYPMSFLSNANINATMISSKNTYDHYLFMKELNKMTGSNSYIEKVIYYSKESGRFFGNLGDSYLENEFNSKKSTFQYDRWAHIDMMSELNTLNYVKIRPMENIKIFSDVGYKAITILMPVPYGTSNPTGIMMVIVKQNKLFYQMATTKTGEYSNAILLNKENEVLAYAKKADYLENLSGDMIKMIEEGKEIIQLDDDQYFAAVRQTNIGSIKIMVVTSKNRILSETEQLSASLLYIFVVVLLLYFLITYAFLRFSYRPLRFLQKKVIQELPEDSEESCDEVQYISRAFDYLKKENRELIEQIVLSKNISLELYLIKFVTGQFDNSEEMWKKAEDCGMKLMKNILCFTVYIADRNVISALGDLNQLLHNAKGEKQKYLCYMLKGQQHEDFIILMTYDDRSETEKFYAGLYQTDSNINIGIGSEETPEDVKKSYMLSLAALEYAITRSNANIMEYNEIEYDNQDKMKEVFNQLSVMERAILQQNEKKLYEAMYSAINILRNRVVRIMFQKTVYISIYNVMVKGLNQAGIDTEYLYAVTGNSLDLNEAEEALSQMYQRLIIEFHKENKQIDINKVLSYIDEHYMEPLLSLYAMGDEFSMSYSNFSHFFKKNAGCTFTSYLEMLRIEKAKEYLLDDSVSIDIVASRVGYNSANSLNRAFKKREGQTPGEYRKGGSEQ